MHTEMFKKAEKQINEDDEFYRLIRFVRNEAENGDERLYLEQIRALWTAYCIHNRFQVDTYEYDTQLHYLYNLMNAEYVNKKNWSFDDFDGFMCEHLV